MFDLVSGVSHGLFISFTIYAAELDVGNIEWLKVDVFILERFVDFYCNFEFAGLSGTFHAFRTHQRPKVRHVCMCGIQITLHEKVIGKMQDFRNGEQSLVRRATVPIFILRNKLLADP